MSKNDRSQIIVLLADGFEETGVSIVLTTLRQAGLAVNLVGLRSQRVSGAHGLVIVPNTSLDRMLEIAAPMRALILPEGAGHLARLRVDPRVDQLLQRSFVEHIMIVGLGDQAVRMVVDMGPGKGSRFNLLAPEAGTHPEDFAALLVQRLVGMTEVFMGR